MDDRCNNSEPEDVEAVTQIVTSLPSATAAHVLGKYEVVGSIPTVGPIALSFKGRTDDCYSSYRGSNPCEAATELSIDLRNGLVEQRAVDRKGCLFYLGLVLDFRASTLDLSNVAKIAQHESIG